VNLLYMFCAVAAIVVVMVGLLSVQSALVGLARRVVEQEGWEDPPRGQILRALRTQLPSDPPDEDVASELGLDPWQRGAN